MELEEVLVLDGTKLLDTNVVLPQDETEGGILARIYDCKIPSNIPRKTIRDLCLQIRNGIHFLQQPDVFSIQEVADELEPLLENLSKYHDFMSQAKDRPKKFVKCNGKKIKRFKEKPKKRVFRRQEQDTLAELNGACNGLKHLIGAVEVKDITQTFSTTQNSLYQKLIKYFVYIAEEHDLKRDMRKVYNAHFKRRTISDSNTEEKLVSAALVISLERPTILISNDSDVIRILGFLNDFPETTNPFNLPEINTDNLFLYSNLKKPPNRRDGYELQTEQMMRFELEKALARSKF